jgi:DNA polymerase-1
MGSTQQYPLLLLIDGHALAYRAFFGMPATFKTMHGEATHAVYGFTAMLLGVWKEYQPDYIAVAFDHGKTFRHDTYREYKATRQKMPGELRTQMTRIEQLVQAFNMPIYTTPGYEADDILGTLGVQAVKNDLKVLIVTGDRDALQLIGPYLRVVLPGRVFAEREVYDEAAVQKRYSLTPAKLVDLKGLIGDTSDNIPGVDGIGDKTAIKLIQAYGSLAGVYANLSSLTPTLRSRLETGREKAFLSSALGLIKTDVPGITFNLEAGKALEFDLTKVADLFVELEFSSIFNRVPGAPPDKSAKDIAGHHRAGPHSPIAPDGIYHTVNTKTKLDELVVKLAQSRSLAVDVETDSTDAIRANLVGLAITPAAGEGYYLPLGHRIATTWAVAPAQDQTTLFDQLPQTGDRLAQLDLSVVQQALVPILTHPAITKYMHNAKFDMTVLERHGLPVAPPIYDTMIAAWLTDNAPGARYGLKDLVRQHLNIQMTEIKELIGSGKNQRSMADVPIEDCAPYACADVDMTLRLVSPMDQRLKKDDEAAWRVFQELELPLIYVLKDMELAGVKLDVALLRELSGQLAAQLGKLERDITAAAGRPFNINSTQQLSDILFKELKLPSVGLRTTKSGHFSTAAEVLEGLLGKHPIIDLILQHRSVAKLKSTYVDALPAMVNPATGRVHTNYNQIGIATGRLSSSDPGLQNIPIRTEQGREIRRAFITEPGHVLISADYSQVELRILAHITGDPGLTQAFLNDEDVHLSTAAAVLGIPLSEVSKEQRRIAKTVNYGLAYGQTAFGLSRSTGMSQRDATAFIETYFEKYPSVGRYITETKQFAAEHGYLATLYGRKRDFSILKTLPQGPQRLAVEREAINSPIQGSAADIMKQAMINLHLALRARGLKTRILLQVHDELVLEAPEAEVDQAARLTREVMSTAFALNVPLVVDVEAGLNWLDMEAV